MRHPFDSRGFTLTELLVALVVTSVGILALARLFPTSARSGERAQMQSAATLFAQEKLEELQSVAWTDTALTTGRHPAGSATEALGSGGAWRRWYQVTGMAAPMDDVKQVTVTVRWNAGGTRSTSTTTYLKR